MEYRTLQHAKLKRHPAPARARRRARARLRRGAAPLRGEVALVTGAAGAIGTGICEGLLLAGALVAATDLAGAPLDTLVENLGAVYPGAHHGSSARRDRSRSPSPLPSTGWCTAWGGVDLVIPNAGIAAVSPLIELDLDRYRLLEKVNVEGTLLVLAEAARLFRRQGTGGDIVLVSTKNVFAPGANFGAYSSTKAAAHQLARIASLEFAGGRRARQHGGSRRGLRPRHLPLGPVGRGGARSHEGPGTG